MPCSYWVIRSVSEIRCEVLEELRTKISILNCVRSSFFELVFRWNAKIGIFLKAQFVLFNREIYFVESFIHEYEFRIRKGRLELDSFGLIEFQHYNTIC